MDEKSDTQIVGNVAVADPPAASATGARARAPRPMFLIVVAGGVPGAMIRLNPRETSLGRSGQNDVKVPDLGVSRHHARIAVDARGAAWLTDLGSTNGSYVNNRRVLPLSPVRLEDGDRVQFGAALVVKFVGLDPCDERFQRELFERSVRDPLTGLFHRAYFVDQLPRTAESAASRGLGLAVLMLDVDHFKAVNDTHGHDAGDLVLREVAQVLRDHTRSDDLVARYGGEEFVLALPVAAPDQATERAERLRADVAARRVSVGGAWVRVTASLGLAFAHPGRTRHTSALVTAADRALYQAKNSGRDRVVFRADLSGAVGSVDRDGTPPTASLED